MLFGIVRKLVHICHVHMVDRDDFIVLLKACSLCRALFNHIRKDNFSAALQSFVHLVIDTDVVTRGINRIISCGMLLTVPNVCNCDRVLRNAVQSFVKRKIPAEADVMLLILHDDIVFLKTGLLCNSRIHIRNISRIITDRVQNDQGQDKCQDEVEERSGKYDADPLPDGFRVKRTFLRRIIRFPEHLAGTAEGQKLQGI